MTIDDAVEVRAGPGSARQLLQRRRPSRLARSVGRTPAATSCAARRRCSSTSRSRARCRSPRAQRLEAAVGDLQRAEHARVRQPGVHVRRQRIRHGRSHHLHHRRPAHDAAGGSLPVLGGDHAKRTLTRRIAIAVCWAPCARQQPRLRRAGRRRSRRAQAAQPAVPMRWYKGNTHTHTINNGGDSTPDEVVRWYRDARLSVPGADRSQLPHPRRRPQRHPRRRREVPGRPRRRGDVAAPATSRSTSTVSTSSAGRGVQRRARSARRCSATSTASAPRRACRTSTIRTSDGR